MERQILQALRLWLQRHARGTAADPPSASGDKAVPSSVTHGATAVDEQGRLEEISQLEEAGIWQAVLANPSGPSAVCVSVCVCEWQQPAVFPGALWPWSYSTFLGLTYSIPVSSGSVTPRGSSSLPQLISVYNRLLFNQCNVVETRRCCSVKIWLRKCWLMWALWQICTKVTLSTVLFGL